MQYNVPPRLTLLATDLDSGDDLYHLVAAVARQLGRPVDWSNVDVPAARDAAGCLLVVLGLAEPAAPPALPDGVEGVPLGGRHQ